MYILMNARDANAMHSKKMQENEQKCAVMRLGKKPHAFGEETTLIPCGDQLLQGETAGN